MNPTTKTSVQILTEARALIANPADWIKGSYRRVVETGVCYCSMGAVREAIEYVSRPMHEVWVMEDKARAYLDRVAQQRTGSLFASIIDYNDRETTTHADVLSVFDEAILAARIDEVRQARVEWVAALRSGKYPQGVGKLKDFSGGYCCLGVAQDQAGEWCGTSYYFPNSEVSARLGLGPDYQSGVDGSDYDARCKEASFPVLNDQLGFTFDDIADVIESGCVPIFIDGVEVGL